MSSQQKSRHSAGQRRLSYTPAEQRRQDGGAPSGDTRQTPRSQTDQQVNLAIRSLRSGRLRDAEGYLRAALETQCDHALAHNCLGIVLRSQGKLKEAVASYLKAILYRPDYAEAHNNLGVARESLGDNGQAIASYQAAIRHKGDFAAAYNNMGNALCKEGQFFDAVSSLERALQIKPSFPEAHNNLGLALRGLGQIERAEASFRRALGHNRAFAEAYVNLGNVLHAQHKHDAAAECFHLAIQSKPRFVSAHCGLGNVLLAQRRFDQASESYRQAIALAPQHAEAHFGLGSLCRESGQIDRAIAHYRQAVDSQPRFAEAHNNLGNLLGTRGDLAAAEQCFQHAIEADPDYLVAYNNLGNLYRLQDRLEEAATAYREVIRRRPASPLESLRLSTLCPTVFRSLDEAQQYYEQTLAHWQSLEGACTYTTLVDLLNAVNEPPFNLQFFSRDVRPIKEAYARIFRYAGTEPDFAKPSGRIRLGLVVTSKHEIAFLRLIWDALRQMDPEQFELTLVCTTQAAPKFRRTIDDPAVQIMALPDRPDETLAALRGARFDILYYFEIGTDILNYFLPFFRLAPVQCTAWGIQVTSGIPNVDYYLSSALVEPEQAELHYSEQLIRAATLLAYQKPVQLPGRPKTRACFGFDDSQHLYLCAQHLGKFHPDFDPMLADILRQDPQGIVVVTKDRHGYCVERLRERFLQSIPDVADRIVFVPRQRLPDYLSLVACSDLLLDPPHFGGVNTTYDALALDKPIVSLPSRFHRGRYTLGCYRKMNIYDLIASNPEDYVRIAVGLGRDADRRQEVGERIHRAKHRIFYDAEAVREHERIFRELVEKAG